MKFAPTQVHLYKTNCLRWLRLQQRCAFIATEVGPYSCDVFGVSEKKTYELEVKVTMADLRNDIRAKQYKHMNYRDTHMGHGRDLAWHPQYFYFVVTPDMVDEALCYVEHPDIAKYGLINGETMAVVKTPRRLHDREPKSSVKFTMALRMGSDLIRFYNDWVK